MLGSKMAEVLVQRSHNVLKPERAEIDLAQPETMEKYFKTHDFEILINCAAYTRVDACEEPSQYSLALNLNGAAPAWLARFCRKTNRKLIHFSSDYVFDGNKADPYTEEDTPHPLNVYGRTKWQGEKLILAEKPFFYLVRSSWLFGPNGKHFVNTLLKTLKTRPKVEVVSDQVGGPTYTGDLALFTLDLLEKKAEPGIYHFANEGYVSWFDFALEIQRQTGLHQCKVVPALSDNIFRPALRPANSGFNLDKARKVVSSLRPWYEGLKDYLTKDWMNEPA